MESPGGPAHVERLIDALVEESLQARRTVPETLAVVLPALAAAAGASGVLLRTYGDDLALASHVWPAGFRLPCLNHACDDDVGVMSDLFHR